ncbi:membrane protein [Rhodopirellula maiorica SM1]|uniref:Membrane protein n=1 Tax=Rhodopirellula maiorica SM1 TaxID=1265738 RepID=M5RRE7_9BACT|nr:membrane protein [Rhodopirellula maiorica SM1]
MTISKPYQSPVTLEPASAARTQFTRYPGLCLSALSAVAILADAPIGFFTIVDSVRVSLAGDFLLGIAVAAGTLLFILAHLAVLVGAINMVRGKSNRISWLAAVIACVPVLSPGIILGIPLGIWSLVALQKSNSD